MERWRHWLCRSLFTYSKGAVKIERRRCTGGMGESDIPGGIGIVRSIGRGLCQHVEHGAAAKNDEARRRSWKEESLFRPAIMSSLPRGELVGRTAKGENTALIESGSDLRWRKRNKDMRCQRLRRDNVTGFAGIVPKRRQDANTRCPRRPTTTLLGTFNCIFLIEGRGLRFGTAYDSFVLLSRDLKAWESALKRPLTRNQKVQPDPLNHSTVTFIS
ncbi:hypothetical protein KC343_g10 [Hortaea werneckii]|nr:hypothetical protein KC317_g10 [Hortaea werneckii]KAI7638465.1 hypothetical protein KC343_g10 [Hortaea werneckii]